MSGDRYFSGLSWVGELPVTAFLISQQPPIASQHFQHVPDLHSTSPGRPFAFDDVLGEDFDGDGTVEPCRGFCRLPMPLPPTPIRDRVS